MPNDFSSPNSIVQLFNVDSVGHLAAYRHFDQHGVWPTGFIESLGEKVEFPHLWLLRIQSKIIEAYLASVLSKNGGESGK